MPDDRLATPSSRELDGEGIWDATTNKTGWNALLGDRRGGSDVSIYAGPARATDLTGLPTAFVDVGSVETFRDEDIDYAARLLQAVVQTELHIRPGGFHGFDGMAPQASLSRTASATRAAWVRRLLAEGRG
jgi:acetyl esterase/lipase